MDWAVGNVKRISGRSASTGRGTGIAVAYAETLGSYNGTVVVLDRPLTAEIALNVRSAVAVVGAAGGVTSHGANLLRELNVPCVLGVDVSQIALGESITVDATSGEV